MSNNHSHKALPDKCAAQGVAPTETHTTRLDNLSSTHSDRATPSNQTTTFDSTAATSRNSTLSSTPTRTPTLIAAGYSSRLRHFSSTQDESMQEWALHGHNRTLNDHSTPYPAAEPPSHPVQENEDRSLINELYRSMSPPMRDYYGVGAEQRSHVSTARGNVAVTRHSSNTGLPVANAIVTSTEHRIWVPPTYLSQEQRAFNSQLTTQALPAHTSRAHRSLHASTDQRYGGPRLVATSSIAHGPFPSPRGPPGMSNLVPRNHHQAVQSFRREPSSATHERPTVDTATTSAFGAQHNGRGAPGLRNLSHAIVKVEETEDANAKYNNVEHEEPAQHRTIKKSPDQPTKARTSGIVFSSQSYPRGTKRQPKKEEEKKKKGKGSAAYSKIFEDAPSVRIALPEMVIGAYELLAYFPNHTQWPAAIIRLICNEWSTDNISAAQLFARGHQSGDEHHRRAGAVRHQVLQGGREFFRLANFTRQRYPSLMHHRELADASLWRPRTNITALDNARLVTLAQGVVNAPLGQDRGLVAQAIEIAVRDARLDWYVTDIPSVVQQYGLQLPPEAANIARWDINARARFHTRLTAAGGIRPRIDTL